MASKKQESVFDLSIGDLMAALLLIFVLLLSSTLLMLQKEFEVKNKVAERYSATKDSLYLALFEEFKEDFKKWDAELDRATLSIRFKEPEVLFETNKYDLKLRFKEILDGFFLRYVSVLQRPEFKENIVEIRIEGHTDSRGNYYHNMELSQNRTRSVLEYVLEQTKISSTEKIWVQKLLTANGLSFSQPRYIDGTNNEDMDGSRRVEFRIRTNAEKQIEEMLDYKVRSGLVK